VSREQNGTLHLRLQGESNATYVVQISTNLISWENFATAQLTNGLADLTYTSTATHHSFLRARSQQTVTFPFVTPQVDPSLTVTSVIHPDGGKMNLFTRDLRMITIEFPPGCFLHPTEVRATSVTNLVGLPFARGSLGTVQLEPEGLGLLNAATINIEYPAGIDSRSVVSFSANNDGTGFGLALDRPLSNNVAIPITFLGLYGSSTGTLAEVESLTRGTLAAQAFSIGNPLVDEQCRIFYPDRFRADFSQFPQTTLECFKELGDRAIEVQLAIRAFLICEVQDPLSHLIAIVRARELLGAITPEESAQLRANILKDRLCPLYEQKIAPLWQEAKGNCALAIVLMQTMLGFEQQLQTAGLTNAPCNYTLGGNLASVCESAKTCLQEIRTCCALGHKGQQKYAEIVQLVNKFELFTGDTCLPGGMNNLDVDNNRHRMPQATPGTEPSPSASPAPTPKQRTVQGGTMTEIEDTDVNTTVKFSKRLLPPFPASAPTPHCKSAAYSFVDLDQMIITLPQHWVPRGADSPISRPMA
jgi:hypothetical protein